ncbi:hypothetical protein THASP1DRAFT_11968, partial [Thamnocephalis sphaerospora]
WSDVTPVPQDDGPDPVCPIAYSSEYADAMSYFRAVSAKREYSTRALELTGTIIDMNPGHYTVWLYRKDIVFALDLDFQQELDFVESVANETPKCYQLWHHRQVIIEKLGDASQELAFIERVLNGDPKNFHAWSYRQWVIKTFNLWDGELAFVDQLLDSDIRNNSAWNQRYFALHYRPTPADNETLQREVDYAIKKIRLAPHNESAWNYLAGWVNVADGSRYVTKCSSFWHFAEQFGASQNDCLLVWMILSQRWRLKHPFQCLCWLLLWKASKNMPSWATISSDVRRRFG